MYEEQVKQAILDACRAAGAKVLSPSSEDGVKVGFPITYLAINRYGICHCRRYLNLFRILNLFFFSGLRNPRRLWLIWSARIHPPRPEPELFRGNGPRPETGIFPAGKIRYRARRRPAHAQSTAAELSFNWFSYLLRSAGMRSAASAAKQKSATDRGRSYTYPGWGGWWAERKFYTGTDHPGIKNQRFRWISARQSK